MMSEWYKLANAIKGRVVIPGSVGFLTVKNSLVWNEIKPGRSPACIVIVKDEDDVVTAVNFARLAGLQITVRGGGHSWSGLAVRRGGMTIDLSELCNFRIDKATSTAVIQPSISNQQLALALAKYELAFPVGHCPTVKASGYLLNGGMSWNMSAWGPACFSVSAVECITAKGEKITASAEEHAELFWAARGCGPGMFAVATQFHLTCYPLPKTIMTSTYFCSLEQLHQTVSEVTDLGLKMPSFVELSVFLIKAPLELMSQCQSTNGKLCMISAVAFSNEEQDALDALAILETSKMAEQCLLKSVYQSSSFENILAASGATWPEHRRNLAENQCSDAKPADMLLALRGKIIDAPSAESVIAFCLSTGKRNLLESNADVALSMYGSSYGGAWAIWQKPEDDISNSTWHNETLAILKSFTNLHYIGETDFVQDNSRLQASFTPEKWQRLRVIRKKYDPNGLFFDYLEGL